MKVLLLSATVALLGGSVQAATLDFSGNICGGGTSCTDAEGIDQSYGDMTGVDVEYDGDQGLSGLQNFNYWNDSYGDLTGVAYYGEGATLSFLAATGYKVFLDSLETAGWPNSNRILGFTVTDLFDGSILYSTPAGTVAPGTGHADFNLALSSIVGLKITFVGDFFNGGVDNIVYRAEPTQPNPSPVPLPAGMWLLGGGLAALAAMRRRKN